MKRTRRFPVWRVAPALLAFGLSAGVAAAQTIGLDVEAGYRYLDLSGNRDMYRSQINERSGTLFRNVSFTAADGGNSGLFDHITFNANELGIGPVGGFRFDAGKSGLYRIRASFRSADMYSALPGFANPLYGSGIIPGQHTYDRHRITFDADVEILPGGVITPIVGYSRNTYSGPGTTTYTVGQDEFHFSQSLFDVDQEVRVGASFTVGGWLSGQVIQGWRKFSQDETVRLATDTSGNNTGPVLGVPVTLSSFFRHTDTDINTPATSAVVTARPIPGLRIVAHYERAKGTSDTDENENLTGNLVSFEISRFFHGFTDTISSRAEATQWTGGGRVEYDLLQYVDLEAGFERRHRERDGFALITDLFTNTTLFSGLNPADVTRVIQANTTLDRTEDLYEINAVSRHLGPLSLRGGYSQTDQDLVVTEDPSEIVVPGSQGGEFHRTIKAYKAEADFRLAGFLFGGSWRRERADIAVVRTDFLDRDRYRLRIGYGVANLIQLSATGEQTDVKNRDTSIDLSGRIRQYGGEVDVTPAKPVHFLFAANCYQADNTMLIRQPADFSTLRSVHTENGVSYEGSLDVNLSRVVFEGGYAWFQNKGVFPFTINRVRMRAEVPITANLSGSVEWLKDKYLEKAAGQPNLGNYDADRYGFFLRWRQ